MAMTDKWTWAQQSVIGAILIDPACAPVVLPEMRPSDFGSTLGKVYEAITALAADKVPIDPVTILHRMGDPPELNRLFADLMNLTPTAANVMEYVQICKEEARLSLLQQTGIEIATAKTLEDARAALAEAAAVSLESEARSTVSANKAVTEWWESFSSGEKVEYIRCGIDCIDNYIHTLPGNYHVIAGRPGHGKSAIAIQMAYGMSRTLRVGFFAYETGKEEWTDRLITHVSGVNYANIQKRELNADETKAVVKACGEIYRGDGGNLFYEGASGMTVDDIRAVCLRQNYQVIFVDYLQLVNVPHSRPGERVQAVTEISLGLRSLASKFGIVVFALSQLSRAQKTTGEFDAVPKLSDLRESGQIEQDANAVLMVHAPYKTSEPQMRILDIAKNRNGETRMFYADFDGAAQTFREPSNENFLRYRKLMKDDYDTVSGKDAVDYLKNRSLEAAARNRKQREAEKQ